MNTPSPRIILTTGGTGGHVFPALAVAEQLRKLAPDTDILFVGSDYGPERRLATEAGLKFRGLPVRGVLGRGFQSVPAIVGMARAVMRVRRILREFQPCVVAGFGAYASVPALVAAKTLGVPVAVHEQNAVPGISNRLLGKLARRIFLSLPDTRHAFEPTRSELTGNPVRSSIALLHEQNFKPVERRKPRLLVMGGSQGAKAINSAVLAGLNRLGDVDIRHQTGEADFERTRAGYQGHGHTGLVSPFITDMAAVYQWADMVLCRSGASTVAELAVAGKPAVFMPFPHATHDHQTENARAMVTANAARMVAEADVPSVDLAGLVRKILFDNQQLRAMSTAARACAKPDAARCVAQGLLALAAAGKRHV